LAFELKTKSEKNPNIIIAAKVFEELINYFFLNFDSESHFVLYFALFIILNKIKLEAMDTQFFLFFFLFLFCLIEKKCMYKKYKRVWGEKLRNFFLIQFFYFLVV
jgi:hypothetical protein